MIGERYIAVSDLRKHLEILKKETCWNTDVCDPDTIERVLMVVENDLARIDTIGPRQLSSKLLKSISMTIEIWRDMAKDHRKRCREQEKIAESKNNLLLMGLYRGMAETEGQYIETFTGISKHLPVYRNI
mgnify:FL=1